LQSGIVRQRRLVDAAAAQGVVNVADGGNAGGERDVFPFQTIGIAGAVVALMVMRAMSIRHLQKSLGRVALLGDRGQRLGAMIVCALHDDALVAVELAGLEENVIGQADLADVVQRGRSTPGDR